MYSKSNVHRVKYCVPAYFDQSPIIQQGLRLHVNPLSQSSTKYRAIRHAIANTVPSKVRHFSISLSTYLPAVLSPCFSAYRFA